MYVNQIDNFFDNIIDKFNEYLEINNVFKKLNKETNFVKFQNYIMKTIYKFVDDLPEKEILAITNNKNYITIIYDIIKRYAAFYIYLGIGYYYKGSRDLYITNLIESSKNQQNESLKIDNFFNSISNSKLILYFNDIQNIKSLVEFKTLDKIKSILSNNPIKYYSTINLFNDIGDDDIISNFMIEDNFHNILKILIFKQMYLYEEKKEINNILNSIEENDAEYRYIEIMISNDRKIVDLNIIQNFLSYSQLKSGLAEEIYSYLEEMKDNNDFVVKENQDFVNFLFNNKILIPVTEEFLRFHKNTEKYEAFNQSDKKSTENTKIKYIISKIDSVKNYYSPENITKKKDINKLFYKQLDPKMAVLYNDNEEEKIIQKLKLIENTPDFDLLIELQTMRKYSYVNFKTSNNDYIKIRTINTIDAIRSTNLYATKNEFIETRIGHSNIDLNVIGICWNPTRLNINKTSKITTPLDCFKTKDLIDVKNLTKKKNGFTSFIDIFNKTINGSIKKKLYYWLFDNKTDKSTNMSYNEGSLDNSNKNIKNMLAEIYNIYIENIKIKFEKYINKLKKISVLELHKLFRIYEIKYFNFDFLPNIKNELINKALISKLIEYDVIEDENDNIIPGTRKNIIFLPTLVAKIDIKNIIIINDSLINVQTDLTETYEHKHTPECIHYFIWDEIKKKTKAINFTQLIFDFVKQYVRPSKNDDGYLCKSCNAYLELEKYVFEGTYVEELDIFLTTSLIVRRDLEKLPQYVIYNKIIKNTGKQLEKIAYRAGLTAYLGNTTGILLLRKEVIKDVIDLILIHTEYIKTQPSNRIDVAGINYNINKNLTNLFFFELNDDIVLNLSTDIDKYKKIKYNNIIAYLIFIIITKITEGQILNLKDDINCNYFIYSKIADLIFDNLQIKLNEKEKIKITKIPLLCYCIYYFSYILTKNNLWLYETIITPGKKPVFNANIQKAIIHTLLDLINSVIDANLPKKTENNEKNYLYELLVARFFQKVEKIFYNKNIIKLIENRINSKINYNEITQKREFIKKEKIKFIKIQPTAIEIENLFIMQYCNLPFAEIEKKTATTNNNINTLTNCNDGKFHKWKAIEGKLKCSLCDIEYISQKKNIEKNSDKTNINIHNVLKNLYSLKLTKIYCLSGEQHIIDSKTNICSLCHINPNVFKYSQLDLDKINEDIKKKEFDKNAKLIKENDMKKNKINNDYDKILHKFNKKYNKYVKNNFEAYITEFVDKIIDILGNTKILVPFKNKKENIEIYIKDTLYILNHDYLGNKLKKNIKILASEKKILFSYNHPYFKKDILYYVDEYNKVSVYYDIITHQYLGYSSDNKVIRKINNDASIIKQHSIKDCLLLLGFKNESINLYQFNSDNYNEPDEINNKKIINILVRNRIINIKQLISNNIKIIYNIKNHGKSKGIYNVEEIEIINEFTKKLKNFTMKKIFNDYNDIKYVLNMDTIKNNIDLKINNDYFYCDFINNINNTDSKLIFYLVYNFNKILSYNDQPAIQSALVHLIIKIILFNFNSYYQPTNDSDIRKYDFILCNNKNISLFDDTSLAEDNYLQYENIIVNNESINDEIDKFAINLTDEVDQDNYNEKMDEIKYDNEEALNALDIEDYDVDDDIDENAQVLNDAE